MTTDDTGSRPDQDQEFDASEPGEDEPAVADTYRWLGDQASRMHAYRDALSDRLHAALQLVGEDAIAGLDGMAAADLEGVRIVTHKDLELVLASVELPPPSGHAADVETPATITVYAVCPDCGEGTYLATALGAELRVGNGKRELRLTHSASSAPHHHGQRAMRVASPDSEVDGQVTLADVLEGQAIHLPDDPADAGEDD